MFNINFVANPTQRNVSVIVAYLDENEFAAVMESVRRTWNFDGNTLVWITPHSRGMMTETLDRGYKLLRL